MTAEHAFLLARVYLNDIVKDYPSWITTADPPFAATDPVDIDNQILSDLYGLYVSVYQKIGNRLYLTKKDQIFKYNRWVLIYDDENKLVGFALFHTHHAGLKLGLTGCVDTPSVKAALKAFLRNVFGIDKVFGEVSPPLENALKGHVPQVKSKHATRILSGKKITKYYSDGYHYKRNIQNIGEQKKMIIGKPRIR